MSNDDYTEKLQTFSGIPRAKLKSQLTPVMDDDRNIEYNRNRSCNAYSRATYDNAAYAGYLEENNKIRHNSAAPSDKKSGNGGYKCVIIVIISMLCAILTVTGILVGVTFMLIKENSQTTSSVPHETTTAIPNAGWMQWSAWSECDVTCGGGYRFRSRECVPPKSACVGPQNHTEICGTSRCPLPKYASWNKWASWSECSASCNGGEQTRSRVCNKKPNELPCEGDSQQERICNDWNCPSCSRTCPGGGNYLPPRCHRCTCTSNPTFSAIVTDSYNLPLESVKISESELPGETITTTEKNGRFSIPRACQGVDLQFEKVNYVTKTEKIAVGIFQIKMEKVVYLSISEHPEDKHRITGESVTFCCGVFGKPPPDYIEWFQDDVIQETIPYDHNISSFTVHNLTAEHEGFYRCRASNDYSSVYSENSRLTVKASTNDFCPSDPSPNLLTLPPGCSYNGLGSIDKGYCAPVPCRGRTVDTVCWQKQKNCCGPVEYTLLQVKCVGFTLPVATVKSCGCSKCKTPVINIIGRASSSEDNSPLKFGQVLLNGTVVSQTNIDGNYMLTVPSGTRRAVITIRDTSTKFIETTVIKYFREGADGTFHMYVPMKPVGERITMNSNEGKTLLLGKGDIPFAAVDIPPNSFYTLNGKAYNGMVLMYVNVVDPRNETDVKDAPGDLSYIDVQGNQQLLQTYGMFSILFKSATTDERLQLKEKVTVALNGDMVTFNASKPKLWTLNSNTGNWEGGFELNNTDSLSDIPQFKGVQGIDTFADYLVGDIEISVTYPWNNFDGQSERACHSKVRVFSDNKFQESSQLPLDDFNIVVLIEESGGVYSSSNIRAWTDNHEMPGYCLIHLCERTAGTADYKAYLIGYSGDDPNENRLRPAAPSDSGIDEAIMQAIEYNIIDDDAHGAIEFKPMLHVAKQGPFYDWDGYDKGIKDWAYSEACSNANFSANHFRLYANDVTDRCFYEYNVLDLIENCDLQPAVFNTLAWYAEAHNNLHRVCYIKVLVENGNNLTFRALSKMGNGTIGEVYPLYGIRDRCPNSESQALCLEIKHAGEITTDCKNTREDHTFLQVGQYPENEGDAVLCERTDINDNYTALYRSRIIDIGDTNLFQSYIENINYGSSFGIYCHELEGDNTLNEAKEVALASCMNGIDSKYITKPQKANNEQWAVKFSCTTK